MTSFWSTEPVPFSGPLHDVPAEAVRVMLRSPDEYVALAAAVEILERNRRQQRSKCRVSLETGQAVENRAAPKAVDVSRRQLVDGEWP